MLSDGYIALYAFFMSIRTLITVCSHLTHSHFMVSSKNTHYNRLYLPENNPLRKVLLPTELNAITGTFNAALTLLNEPNCSQFYKIYQNTDDGFKQMIKDNVEYFEYDYMNYMGCDFMPWLKLSKEEKQYSPFYTHYKWHQLIRNFSNAFVKQLKEDNLIDDDIIKWLQNIYPNYKTYGVTESIKRIIGFMYYEQIRHTMCDPEYFNYISSTFSPTKKDCLNSYYISFDTLFYILLTITETQITLPPLTFDCSFLINKDNYKKLHNIYFKFYKDINKFNDEYDYDKKLHPLLKPRLINISTGV